MDPTKKIYYINIFLLLPSLSSRKLVPLGLSIQKSIHKKSHSHWNMRVTNLLKQLQNDDHVTPTEAHTSHLALHVIRIWWIMLPAVVHGYLLRFQAKYTCEKRGSAKLIINLDIRNVLQLRENFYSFNQGSYFCILI